MERFGESETGGDQVYFAAALVQSRRPAVGDWGGRDGWLRLGTVSYHPGFAESLMIGTDAAAESSDAGGRLEPAAMQFSSLQQGVTDTAATARDLWF